MPGFNRAFFYKSGQIVETKQINEPNGSFMLVNDFLYIIIDMPIIEPMIHEDKKIKITS